jgi:hypothetical protein
MLPQAVLEPLRLLLCLLLVPLERPLSSVGVGSAGWPDREKEASIYGWS